MRISSVVFVFFLVVVKGLAQSPAQQVFATALEAYKSGANDSAMARADRAIALNTRFAKAYKLRGDLHQRAKEYDLAFAEYKQAEQLDPNDSRLYVSRGALRISQGMHKAALKDCQKAIDLDPTDPDAYYNRACALYLTGDVEGAKKDSEKAIALKPDHAEALYLSGVAKGELYDEDAGLEDINAALAMDPKIPGGLMSVAVLLFESERYAEAIDKFAEVIASDTTELAAAHYYRGDCFYNLKNKEEACKDWEISARLGDKDAIFIKKNYCDTDATKIPKKPTRKRHRSVIEF